MIVAGELVTPFHVAVMFVVPSLNPEMVRRFGGGVVGTVMLSPVNKVIEVPAIAEFDATKYEKAASYTGRP